VELDVVKVVPNPDQPRKFFDEEKLQELADSIRAKGLLHPITVKKVGDDTYMIIAGERRFRAFGLLGRATVPAIVSDGDADELALIENIQREDLSPIDEFEAVARLMEKHAYTQGDVAEVLGKSRVSVNELMSLSALSSEYREEARNLKVPKTVLVQIARAESDSERDALWAMVRGGAATLRSVQAAKKSGGQRPFKPTSVGAVLRTGRRFVVAVYSMHPSEQVKIGPIKSAADRLLKQIEELEDRLHGA
jgi:ParB family chromosome partitioning protein